MRFEQKNVLIASSGGSIGISTAKKMADEGANVTLLSRSREDMSCGSLPDAVKCFAVTDFSDESEMKALSETVLQTAGAPDVIVTAIFEKAPAGEWNEIGSDSAHACVRNILTAAETVLKFFMPPMLERESGHVVIVTSAAGRTNVPGTPWPHAIAYAGLTGIIRNAATVFGRNAVTVNGVAVGPVEGMDFDAYLEKNITGMWNRKATGEDAANAIMYLSDDFSTWNTGEIVDLNGGFFAL